MSGKRLISKGQGPGRPKAARQTTSGGHGCIPISLKSFPNLVSSIHLHWSTRIGENGVVAVEFEFTYPAPIRISANERMSQRQVEEALSEYWITLTTHLTHPNETKLPNGDKQNETSIYLVTKVNLLCVIIQKKWKCTSAKAYKISYE